MSIDERHVALPKLYGAPAYARPPPPVNLSPRPFDPDQLPLEVFQTDEEREDAAHLPAHAYPPTGDSRGDSSEATNGSGGGLRPQLFKLRAIAGRLLGND